jgi:uncharacterized protein YfaS (alpha-2-macroglobulin family)
MVPGQFSRVRWFAALVALVVLAASCSSGDGDGDAGPASDPDANTQRSQPGAVLTTSAFTSGPFTIKLSTGSAGEADIDPTAVVEGDRIGDDEVDDLFSRLPDLDEDAEDRQDFNRPPDSPPPPQVGETIDVPFGDGGDGDAPEVVDGPLEVLRFQPEGDVAIAPSIAITFNQPMVPLATLEQLGDQDVPVTITPAVSGTWNWIGTRTLRFEHDGQDIDRLPAATTYTAEVPAGTTSETGGELAEAVSFGFTTPTVQLNRLVPGADSSIDTEQVFVAVFDQRIDPAAVLDTVTLTVDGDAVEVREATGDEISEDERLASLTESALTDRWLAFRPVEPMATNSPVVVQVGPNTPSLEGPNLSDEVRTERMRTYPPLRIESTSCGWNDRCQPYMGWNIEFSNQLDREAFDKSWITVEPELPGMRVDANWESISIQGASAGNTDYTVTIDQALVDIYGQTLAEDEQRTFEVGNADPALNSNNQGLITLDPIADAPSLSLGTINHDSLEVVAYAVSPQDWPDFVDYSQGREDRRGRPDFEQVWTEEVEIDAPQDSFVETAVDLSEALGGEYGHLVVYVSPTGELADLDDDDELFWQNRPFAVWVQSTDLGIDVVNDHDDLLVRVTDLDTGAAVDGAEVSIQAQSGTTASSGLVTLDALRNARNDMRRIIMTASSGDDVAFIPASWGWEQRDDADQLRWYVFDDRHIYRPGETVSVKGWLRNLTTSADAQLELPDGVDSLTYSVRGAQGNELATGEATVSSLGGFDLSFELPQNANLGFAGISLVVPNAVNGFNEHFHQFQVQEFRRPEFEVNASIDTEGPYVVGQPATAQVAATYFAGGGLPDAEVEWSVTKRTTSYSPPNWQDFSFGVWTPWWINDFGGGFDDGFGGGFGGEFVEPEVFSARTDAQGNHFLQMDFDGTDDAQPVNVSAQATVFDVNRQAWASTTNLLVHSSELYVGLRTQRTFVKQGDDLTVSLIATDIDGNAVAGRDLVVEAGLVDWAWVDGDWTEVIAEVETCNVTSADEAVECTFGTDKGGQYKISALVTDDDGRPSRSELTRWVSGGRNRIPSRQVELEEVTLVPDAESYEPGDTAELLVQAPFADGHALITTARNGIVGTEVVAINGDSTIIEVPIDESHVPNVHVQVDLVGATERTDDAGEPLADAPDRPAYATATINLPVPPTTRTLSVDAVPADDAVMPGDDTQVSVTVTDANGDPVADAELAVVVVDEAVLSLSNYQLTDPLKVFYGQLGSEIQTERGRQFIRLVNPDELAKAGSEQTDGGDEATVATTAAAMPSAGGAAQDSMEMAADGEMTDDADGSIARQAGANAAGQPIELRTNFDALAVFDPQVSTNADGTATVAVPLPDNLTRYRVMVVAVDGDDHFGSGESNITARLPLMVRPSAPRFLNFGDVFELPVVVQNQTDAPLEVDVAVRATNLTFTEGAGRLVTVPANDRVEVRFPAEADQAGTARFQVVVDGGGFTDAELRDLPVYTPATTEAFATYGVIDEGVTSQTVLAPDGVYPQFGGLEITTSSTALQALTDAVIYIHDYRYTSSDALSSRIAAITALNDILDAFDADGLPTAAEIEATVNGDIEALEGLQNDDGGFPYWRVGRPSQPYNTLHVAHALTLARQNGYEVDNGVYQRTMNYVRDIETHFEPWYGQQTKDSLSAYALYIRNLGGDADTAKAGALWADRGADMGLEAMAWIWPVLDDAPAEAEIQRVFNNRATEEAGTATFATDYGEDAYVVLHSNRRTDAVILDALISEGPDTDLLPKVVAGLLGNRNANGRWNNIQENVFVLLALNSYFDAFENVDPDFVARIWLGDIYAAEHTYEGRTVEFQETGVTTEELIGQGDADLVISKEGEGRLYYRLGLRYAPDDLDLEALDRGFVVQRTYESADPDSPDDVVRNDDGTWTIKAGAEVRVRLTMVADSRRTHVALIDPMPAGFESVNPALAVSADIPDNPNPNAEAGAGFDSWWWGPWYNHQNLRDDRTEAFTTYLRAGTYEYNYVARATTPGTFVVPPTKAEEMYHPETFGRSASESVTIIDA